jgi:hypothetical protein
MYQQISEELFAEGKSQSLGVKARIGRFRADAHQRAQEKKAHHKYRGETIVVHKTFYAADIHLDDIRVVGIRADFIETQAQPTSVSRASSTTHSGSHASSIPRASELPPEKAIWYNAFDYIDADRKPFDNDPVMEVVDLGECPRVFYSKRVKALQTTPDDDKKSTSTGESGSVKSGLVLESSKFGHEKSHICYLNAAIGVAPTQIRITTERVAELQKTLLDYPTQPTVADKVGRLLDSQSSFADGFSSEIET